MIRLPNEIPAEYVSENLGGHARGYVQQRVLGAFEFDHVSLAPFDLLLQGSYRIDVDLTTHAIVPALSQHAKCIGICPRTLMSTLSPGFLWPVVYPRGYLKEQTWWSREETVTSANTVVHHTTGWRGPSHLVPASVTSSRCADQCQCFFSHQAIARLELIAESLVSTTFNNSVKAKGHCGVDSNLQKPRRGMVRRGQKTKVIMAG